MDNNIIQTVFDSLDADAAGLEKLKTEYAALEAKIKEGRYSNQTLQKEIFPKRDELRRQIHDGGARAIEKAHNLVAQYREEVAHLDELDPSAITDDIKLLTAGVPLLPRDIDAILNRNQGNRTMTQLALRYAEEHGIEMKGTYYVGGENERRIANEADGVIGYYAKWIVQDNARSILRKFFDVQETE